MIKLLKQLRRKVFGLDEQEAALHRVIADTNDLIAIPQKTLEQSLSQFHQSYNQMTLETLAQNAPDTLLTCTINQVKLKVSVNTLLTYVHCLDAYPNMGFCYSVETHCVEWLAQFLQNGDCFLDVGAAYGVISFPLAKVVGDAGKIYAFEPARRTRQGLQRLVDVNQFENITVLPMAIADQAGSAEFIEYSAENQFSWATDTSTLADGVTPTMKHETYAVEIITLDQFVAEQTIIPKAIKIDIEGFELYALQGAKDLLQTAKPYLCIDIHQDVKTQQSSLIEIQPLLESWGYSCELRQHTLFASPNA
ncbi:MAG: FkbM family methyltransferase [Synechocystis sp.]|nr:FkbM family methyltransferase [Synechocystis sp.]